MRAWGAARLASAGGVSTPLRHPAMLRVVQTKICCLISVPCVHDGCWRGGSHLGWELPGVENNAEHEDEEGVEGGEVVIQEHRCLAPNFSPRPRCQPRDQPVQGRGHHEDTDKEVTESKAHNSDMRDLEHGAGEGPVAGQVDEVENDPGSHGDTEKGAVTPPGVVESIVLPEDDADTARAPALHPGPGPVIEQRHDDQVTRSGHWRGSEYHDEIVTLVTGSAVPMY